MKMRISLPKGKVRFSLLAKSPEMGHTTFINHGGNTMNATLNVFDFGFGALEKVSEFDYVQFGETAIKRAAAIAAVVVGVVTYVFTALQLFWLQNGEVISKRAVQFVFLIVDFAGEMLMAGREFRRFVNRLTAQVSDGVFYALAAC